jgi:hypothetical protein
MIQFVGSSPDRMKIMINQDKTTFFAITQAATPRIAKAKPFCR